MNYSRWATVSELKERLTEIKPDSKVNKSGIPMMCEGDNLYIKDDEQHTMIIGATGSGKTQTTVLPVLRLAIKAEESFILNDVKGEIYELLKEDLDKNNYNTIVINLSDPTNSANFNPLSLAEKLYKEGKKDQASDILESIGTYLFRGEKYDPNSDPFWRNSATSLFIGLVLYQFENGVDNVTLNSTAELLDNFDEVEKYYKETSKFVTSAKYLASIVLAPTETKGSIISVFSQSIRLFTTREQLSELMSKTSFDMENIQKDKTALFIITDGTTYTKRMLPSLIIEECYHAVSLTNNASRRLNILIDEFDKLVAIDNLVNILSLARSNKIRFNIYVQSFFDLQNTYGKEKADLLIFNFINMVYLLSFDFNTLEEISKLCGNQKVEGDIEPLVTPEELKMLDQFEAVVLMPRMYPIKTKLVPDYKINW